jgi:hypothetical protein
MPTLWSFTWTCNDTISAWSRFSKMVPYPLGLGFGENPRSIHIEEHPYWLVTKRRVVTH